MIFDCFTFFNELDLLEIRLNTLKDVVDCFVIAEATRTHRGKPKELYFEKNRARYAKFLNRIRYVVVDDLLPEEEVERDVYNLPWVNENRQRNAISKGLEGLRDDDIIMLSDLDEIPRPLAIKDALPIAKNGDAVRFLMEMYCYYANYKDFCNPIWSLGTVMLSGCTWRTSPAFDSFKCDRFTVASENNGRTMQKIRFLNPSIKIRHGGWHMSYLGGVQAIMQKLRAFAHVEASSVAKHVEGRIQSGKSIFGGRRDQFVVPLNEDFPSWLVGNKDRFAHLIFPYDEARDKKYWWWRMCARVRGICHRMVVALIPRPFFDLAVRIWHRIRYR